MAQPFYYGDNLDVMREHIPSNSVDLVYLDPPFNSNRNYNAIFGEQRQEAGGGKPGGCVWVPKEPGV